MIHTTYPEQISKSRSRVYIKNEATLSLIAWLPYRSEKAGIENEILKGHVDQLIVRYINSDSNADSETCNIIGDRWKKKIETFLPIKPASTLILTADQESVKIIPISYECMEVGIEESKSGWKKLISQLKDEHIYRVAVLDDAHISLYEIKGNKKRIIVDLPTDPKDRAKSIHCFENTVRLIQKNRETPLLTYGLGCERLTNNLEFETHMSSNKSLTNHDGIFDTHEQSISRAKYYTTKPFHEKWIKQLIQRAKKEGKWINNPAAIHNALLKNQVSIIIIDPIRATYFQNTDESISLILENNVRLFKTHTNDTGAIL